MNELSPRTPYLQSLLPPDAKLRVLVVDDDRGFCDLMVRTFEMIGFEGHVAHDGHSALDALRAQAFDAVLLDILMPGGMTGLDLCRELRSFSDIPVVMVTALNRAEDVVQSINAGADSVIAKPFRFREAQARVLAVLRRAGTLKTSLPGDSLGDGRQQVKRSANEVTIGGRQRLLSHQEYRLFNLLAAQADQPVSKAEIFEELWGNGQRVNLNLVERVVNRLRAKVEDDPGDPQYIVTCAYGHYMYRRRGRKS
ncbi:MAG: response regulator transcription factor [Caldilineaceae bacterium]|nr:response regulator transcription factor [Caldilinea sp.]MCB0068578.1 response regulator transcription factor [Caldilineaceae bacterium]MCB0136225.1 response regulator transcription factor [Caldilineaceae bacterium]